MINLSQLPIEIFKLIYSFIWNDYTFNIIFWKQTYSIYGSCITCKLKKNYWKFSNKYLSNMFHVRFIEGIDVRLNVSVSKLLPIVCSKTCKRIQDSHFEQFKKEYNYKEYVYGFSIYCKRDNDEYWYPR